MKKLKAYRGDGKYLPLSKGSIDYNAIKENMTLLEAKKKYTGQIYYRLKKDKKFPRYKNIAKNLESTIENILKIKKEAYLGKITPKNLKNKMSKEIKKLKKDYDRFVAKVYFLKSFSYPVDHLANRISYEKAKPKSKKLANKIYFKRRLLEDGAFDKNHTRSDLYLRSTIDTLKLKINKLKDEFDENTRYDLKWMLANVKSQLDRGHKKQIERVKGWSNRASSAVKFYQDVVSLKNAKQLKKSLRDKDKATEALVDFVYKKQADTYKWWMGKSELMRAIFVLETILYNEVGGVDSSDGLERFDVVQIVLNRLNKTQYSKLLSSQNLYKELAMKRQEINKFTWLNTLFKKGEFSFTFHYISSVSKIFCPDMSRAGQRLRKENIKISLKALKNKRKEFNAIRYFSRVSMLGKIDMSSVWSRFRALEERAGFLAKNQTGLLTLFNKGKFDYYYSFKDPEGKVFDVINIKDTTYSLHKAKKKLEINNYRDPNLFTYFLKK